MNNKYGQALCNSLPTLIFITTVSDENICIASTIQNFLQLLKS